MADLPEDKQPEDEKQDPKARTVEYRGLPFAIERDVAVGVKSSYAGYIDIHEIEVSHDFFCHSHTVKVWLYGNGRQEALVSALRELYLIVIAHHATCVVCQECIVYNLVGTDDTGDETDAFGEEGQ